MYRYQLNGFLVPTLGVLHGGIHTGQIRLSAYYGPIVVGTTHVDVLGRIYFRQPAGVSFPQPFSQREMPFYSRLNTFYIYIRIVVTAVNRLVLSRKRRIFVRQSARRCFSENNYGLGTLDSSTLAAVIRERLPETKLLLFIGKREVESARSLHA